MAKDKPSPRQVEKTDRRIEKALKHNGPGVEALAEAVFGKKARKQR